jgi:hypothetical protein
MRQGTLACLLLRGRHVPSCSHLVAMAPFACFALIAACNETPPAQEEPPPTGGKGCTAIGCSDTFVATLSGLLPAHADQLPFTIEGCVDDQCVTGHLVAAGSSPNCPIGSGTPCCSLGDGILASCAVDAGGALLLFVPIPEGAHAGSTSDLDVSIRGVNGDTLLDDSASSPITSHQPNGSGCAPICLSANASFSE